MTYGDLLDRVQVEHLTIFGTLPGARGTILLLGPHEPGFWPAICDSPEWRDGAADPVDRWSRRVITGLADRLDAQTHFPFGTHAAPFLTWALASNRAWTSPVGMLVQAEAGLMVSYRGALEFDWNIQAPEAPTKPCTGCAEPCITACPVGALQGAEYDVEACRSCVRSDPDQRCLTEGCLARRACPVGETYERAAAQSAYHMQEFLN